MGTLLSFVSQVFPAHLLCARHECVATGDKRPITKVALSHSLAALLSRSPGQARAFLGLATGSEQG